MNNFEKYLVELLQGHLLFDGKPVEVRRSLSKKPVLPSITLDVSNLTTNHVYRDIGDTDTVLYERSADITLNLWCNTEEQRETISDQIMNCFYKEQTGYYKYCSNYEDNMCKQLSHMCRVLIENNGRTVKNLCPDPDSYGYEALHVKYGLIDGTVNIEPPFILDEINEHPPILRNVFKCEAAFYEKYELGGISIEGMVFEIENINTNNLYEKENGGNV